MATLLLHYDAEVHVRVFFLFFKYTFEFNVLNGDALSEIAPAHMGGKFADLIAAGHSKRASSYETPAGGAAGNAASRLVSLSSSSSTSSPEISSCKVKDDFVFMTKESYGIAYEKASSTRHDPANSVVVRPVYEAHLLHLARVHAQLIDLQKHGSFERATLLHTYRRQQEMSHMKTEESVEEFYRTCLAQGDASTASAFLSTSIALESRQSNFELQKEILLATMKKVSSSQQAQGPLKIVALLFENTSTQHELKSLIRLWIFQNPFRFLWLNDSQFLFEICNLEWLSKSTPKEKVRSFFVHLSC